VIEVKTTCPLGSECEVIKDNQIHRCAWLIEMGGTHPETLEKITEKGCAIRWLPVMQLEMAKNQMSTTMAAEGVKNEIAKVAEIPLALPSKLIQ